MLWILGPGDVEVLYILRYSIVKIIAILNSPILYMYSLYTLRRQKTFFFKMEQSIETSCQDLPFQRGIFTNLAKTG